MALEVLYLIRHSQAVASHPQGDRFRPLSAEGRARITDILPRAEALGLRADLSLSSPYLRARETRDLFSPLVSPSKTVICQDLTPDSEPADVCEALASWADQGYQRIAVFTHNPLVTALAEVLTLPGAVPCAAVDALVFDTPSVLALTFDQGFGPRSGLPRWILHP